MRTPSSPSLLEKMWGMKENICLDEKGKETKKGPGKGTGKDGIKHPLQK